MAVRGAFIPKNSYPFFGDSVGYMYSGVQDMVLAGVPDYPTSSRPSQLAL